MLTIVYNSAKKMSTNNRNLIKWRSLLVQDSSMNNWKGLNSIVTPISCDHLEQAFTACTYPISPVTHCALACSV